MTRSYRKPYFILSKQWDKFAEHKFRRQVKQDLAWDPDRDWEDLDMSMKPEWGTRMGFDVPPAESAESRVHTAYEKAKRK